VTPDLARGVLGWGVTDALAHTSDLVVSVCPESHTPTVNSDLEKLIIQLCDSWLHACVMPSGDRQLNPGTEQFRLLANGINFPDLSHSELRAAARGLTAVLLHPGLATIIDADHQFFWAWCVELLAGTESDYFEENEDQLRQLMILSCRAACARACGERPPLGLVPEGRIEHNARELIYHSHDVLAYISFPLLEGLLRKQCSAYVSAGGTVLQPFDVPQKGGGVKSYVVGGRPGTCSSVRDMLYLLHGRVANSDLRVDLDEQRNHLQQFAQSGEDGFDVIYNWRNSSMHGEARLSTVGGTVFSMSLLIALSGIVDRFDELRVKANMAVRHSIWQKGSGSRPPWSYYPPYLSMS
jgi:hypothetical protein